MGRPSAVTVGLVAVATAAASLTPSAPPSYPTPNEIRQIVAKDDFRPSGLADNGARGTGPDGLAGPDVPPAGYLGSPDRPYSTPDVNPMYPTSGPVPGSVATDGGGGSSLGIPGIVLTAYQNAASKLALSDPTCQVTWQMIAGIGKVESNHAWGAVAPNGDTSRRILGPVLDGSRWSAIRDTDNGVMDGNSTWDRAVGPMQFIPSSWQIYAADGNDDGFSNPHNVFDASMATGKYLCNGRRTLNLRSDLIAAIYSYNHSDSYVRRVLSWIDGYTSGGARPIEGYGPPPGPLPIDPGPDPEPETPDPDPSDPAPDPTPSPTPTPKPTPSPEGPGDPVPPIPGPPKPTTSPTPKPPSPSPSPPKPTTSPSPVPSPSGSPSPSPSPSPSTSPSPSSSPSPSPSPEPSSSPSPSPSPEPSSPAPSPSPSPSPSPACSPTPTPTPSGQGDETDTPSPAPSGELAPSPVAEATGAAVPPAALLPGEDAPGPAPDDDCSTVP